MKSRKRASSAANSSCVTANVTQESTSETRCSPGTWLRILADKLVQVPVGDEIDDILAVAVKAFQAQLEVVQTLDDIARKHLQGLEEALKLPGGASSLLLDSRAVDSSRQSSSSLEAFHYMLPEGAAAHLGSLEAFEAHADKGLLTVIYADTEQGLQMQNNDDGTWMSGRFLEATLLFWRGTLLKD